MKSGIRMTQISKTQVGMMMVVAGLAAAGAQAQTPCPSPANCFTNPSFEEVNPFDSREPKGWHNLSNPFECVRRFVGDGLTPTFYPVGDPTNPVGALTPRTGTTCISIATPGAGEFRGFTTDTRNFFIPGFPFFDPTFDFNGGDVLVTGFYMIPANAPVEGDVANIKLSVKVGNQDYAELDSFGDRTDLNIQGHTEGLWVPFEIRWPIADIRAEVFFNESLGFFALPPFPNHVKVVIGRFGFGAPASSGVIYWDDVTLVQVAPPPACGWQASGCFADYNGDGGIDGDDVIAFFADWDTANLCADVDASEGVDGDDVISFFASWDAAGIGFPGC